MSLLDNPQVEQALALLAIPEVKVALLHKTNGNVTILTAGYHGHLRDGLNYGAGCGWCDRLVDTVALVLRHHEAAVREEYRPTLEAVKNWQEARKACRFIAPTPAYARLQRAESALASLPLPPRGGE